MRNRLALITGCAAFVSLIAGPALSATYQIDFSVLGSNNVIGTFEAPLGGGTVESLEVAFPDVVFDTRIDTGGGFDYDPVAGDFTGTIEFPTYTNSVAVGICGVGACLLQLYPLPFDPEPGDYLAIDALDGNIDDGTKYSIDPMPLPPAVPLPAGLPMFMLALLGLGALRRLRHG